MFHYLLKLKYINFWKILLSGGQSKTFEDFQAFSFVEFNLEERSPWRGSLRCKQAGNDDFGLEGHMISKIRKEKQGKIYNTLNFRFNNNMHDKYIALRNICHFILIFNLQPMVVKTELCNFSEWKIYPGKGVRFVAKDGRPFLFLSKRTRNFGLRKLKAQRLRWTTAWRRLHKKIKQSDQGKQKKRRVFRQERAIEGVTLEAIKKLKHAKPQDKKALAEQAIRQIKDRKKAQIAKKQGERKVVNKDKQAAQKAQDKAAQKAQKKTKGKK